ncbi:hypothetical protein BX667DRAFT_177398 [Coemansia mojavensis]|nr:hypothetical protein BX667DRAFT_177398 [Coemansia mojavensis]
MHATKMHFGDHLRHAINILTTKVKLKNGYPHATDVQIDQFYKAFRKQIITAITTRFYKDAGFGTITRRAPSVLAPVLNACLPSTIFYEDDRFKDIKGTPEKHIQASFGLAKITKAKDSVPKTTFFPPHSSWIPVNTNTNTGVLCAQRFATRSATNDKLEDIWGQALYMSSKPMQATNEKKFSVVSDTGRVSVSIHKETDVRKQAKLDKEQASGATRKAINARNAAMAVKIAPAIAKAVKRIADNAVDYIPDAAKYADKAVRAMKRKTAQPKNAAK